MRSLGLCGLFQLDSLPPVQQQPHLLPQLFHPTMRTLQIEGCLECADLSVCSVCDESHNFFLNGETLLCEECGIEGCADCGNMSHC